MTDEQKSATMFAGLARMIEHQPGHIAMTASVNLAVFAAKSIGVPLDKFTELVRKVWEAPARPQPGPPRRG